LCFDTFVVPKIEEDWEFDERRIVTGERVWISL
jgi:hypothetical protein